MHNSNENDRAAMVALCKWAMGYVRLSEECRELCLRGLDGTWLVGGDAPESAEDCIEMAISASRNAEAVKMMKGTY